MKKLEFPSVPRPDVSVVMVTYGAPRETRRALATLLENTEPCYEVIVVDNASPDGFGLQLSRELENARVLLNEENRGFGPANNQGAGVANGSLLVFLNSDAFVHRGWLPALRTRIEGDPAVGAVAPRLLNEDGTLQEAGALLFGNGYTQFAGFGDDPNRPAYLFPRELDYGSASCLMVRRKAFFDLGGFDARYAPAYYEDVDLCLALAQNGYRTLYEPRAVVTHARGASGTPELALRLWYRNHPRFVERWRARLASRPEYTPPDGNPRLQAAARDAPASGRLLLATDLFPAREPGDPVALDLAVRLADLDPRARRTLLPAQPPSAPDSVAELCELGWEIADADAVARRTFHYDAVVYCGDRSREIFGGLIESAQPQAVAVVTRRPPASADAVFEELRASLSKAGVPPTRGVPAFEPNSPARLD